MKNWSGDDFGIQPDCPWEQDQKDAEAVCRQLNIPFMSFNFEKEYRARVVDYFFKELRAGHTPNPDIICNNEIKFKLFMDKALSLGADLIATGHYARKILNKNTGVFELHKGIDANKDQGYFLSGLTQKQIDRSLFPVGDYTKTEIRKLAKANNLPVATKPDSQGICFIGEINIKEFIKANLKLVPGPIADKTSGKILGKHQGLELFTIGQREGIGIGGAGEPFYVVEKNRDTNTLFVAQGKNNKYLFKQTVKFKGLKLYADVNPQSGLTAAIRYRQLAERGKLHSKESYFQFQKPQRAPSPGQSIVFYQKSRIIGSAVIS